MGAIQGSINSMLNTVAAATAAGKHAADKKALSKEQGLLAEEQFHEASAELVKLAGESNIASGQVEAAKTALGKTKEGSKANKKRMGELEAAQTAFDELQERIAAKQAMRTRAEMIMKRTGIGGRE
jgi:hypothetical protein